MLKMCSRMSLRMRRKLLHAQCSKHTEHGSERPRVELQDDSRGPFSFSGWRFSLQKMLGDSELRCHQRGVSELQQWSHPLFIQKVRISRVKGTHCLNQLAVSFTKSIHQISNREIIPTDGESFAVIRTGTGNISSPKQ